MGVRLLKIAVIYFVIGIGFGLYALFFTDFRFTGVQSDMYLLGWASLALSGFIYYFFPKAANHFLGKAHFWLHNVGLPIMLVCLFLMIYMEDTFFETGVAIGASITALGILSFLFTVFMNVSASERVQDSASKTSSM